MKDRSRLRMEQDRRLVPRILARLVVVGALLASAVALVPGGPLPVLAGVDPFLSRGVRLSLALLHAALGAGLLVPPARRAAAAGAAALLLGWMAYMGAGGRSLPAVSTGLLLILALLAAAPEDEGPWRPARRPAVALAGSAARILALGLFGRWLLGPWPFLLLIPVGAVLHRRALRTFGGARGAGRPALAWGLVWASVSAVWAVSSTFRG